MTRRRQAAGLDGRNEAVLVMVVWAAYSLANEGSHRTFEPASVAAFTATWIILMAIALATAPPSARTAREGLGAAAVVVLGSLVIFQPTYMTDADAVTMRLIVFGSSLAIGLLWSTPGRNWQSTSVAFAGVVLAATAWFPIRGVPVPGNDVWFSLQQAIDGLTRGQNMYEMTWKGVPSGQVEDAFTYLPMSAVLLAPAKWATGDVRWGLALLTGLCAVLLLRAGRGSTPLDGWSSGGVVSACLLLLTPGQALQTEMAWTEPLILALLLAVLLATERGHVWAAALTLGLALAAKQHVVLLLPLFAAWRPFGVRRAVIATVVASLLCLPWVIAAPGAMFRDTVTFLVDYPASDRSSTLFAVLNMAGVGLPLVVSVAVLCAWITVACWRVRRASAPTSGTSATASGVCLWASTILVLASLLNKQAYYNQWWLAGSFMLAAIAFAGGGARMATPGCPEPEATPGHAR